MLRRALDVERERREEDATGDELPAGEDGRGDGSAPALDEDASGGHRDGTACGPAAEGIQIFLPTALFQGEDAARVPEVKLFNEWVARVRPNWRPDTYAASAWMAGRLLEQAIEQAGPNPTREAVNQVLRGVTKFNANGMLADTGPGVKRPATCYLIAEVNGGKFRRVAPPDAGFRCDAGFWRP